MKLVPSKLIIEGISFGVYQSQFMEVMSLHGYDKWVPHLLRYKALNYLSNGLPGRSLIRLTNGEN